jgi:SAM-dependent methyltransferase
MATSPTILTWMSSLSDPTRARVLRVLERQELAVAELCEVLQLPQSTVSRHLKVLTDDGWASSRREGTSRLYRMAQAHGSAGQRLWSLVREQLASGDTARQDDQRLERVLAARRTRSRAFFASTAGRWDRLREELFGQSPDLRALPGLLDETWTVADLGCGTGPIAEALAPFVERVIGIDTSPEMLRAARRRVGGLANVELRRGDVEALPLADDSVDAAIAVLVLHHLAEPQRALGEIGRVLRPGGRLLVVDMQRHDRAEYRQQMGHVWLGFTAEQLDGWLTEAGFERARVHPLPPDPAARGPALFAASARLAHARGSPPRTGIVETTQPRRRRTQ